MNRTEQLLSHLAALISCDTQNPPREIDEDHPIFDVVQCALPAGFDVSLTDHGLGRVNLLARRGNPKLLFNVHLDTVPVGEGWSKDPLNATIENGRVYGRGSCDIKGAAAALLTIAESTDAQMAFLFSTDEEGASGCCVRRFCEGISEDSYDSVVVAEPTGCRAITSHRGFLSVIGRFHGVAGHSSEARAMEDNAIHAASRWGAAALAELAPESGDARSCFNIGKIDGGVKSNVIADRADVHWSARLPAGRSNDEFFDRVTGVAAADRADWERPFSGPPLPAGGRDAAEAMAFIERRGLEHGGSVDFWTEASLFSETGVPAIVLGPGDIAQAHAVDEWVTIEQLERAEQIYRGLIEGEG